MNVTSIQTLLAGLTPNEYRAAFMSVNATVLRLGQTLGPLLMGAIFGVWGIASVFYAGASLSIVTFMLMVIMLK
jgi:predicted MFS family arabinose efflux permease